MGTPFDPRHAADLVKAHQADLRAMVVSDDALAKSSSPHMRRFGVGRLGLLLIRAGQRLAYRGGVRSAIFLAR